MPRPGPRPYECVRRAWHSERHQPMRGSLIREIFRVVNEFHSTTTRKNKEWQEKLPIVVLKAEEIMYSKANSEAEYMDLKSFWDRVNDAVNTIIRRDESTESGKLLQPCIEAALNLGCTPRRALRSQRHSNLWGYLSSSTQETVDETSIAPKIPPDLNHEDSSPFPPQSVNRICNPQHMSYYSSLAPPTTLNSHQLGSEFCSPLAQEKPVSREQPFSLAMPARGFPFCLENFASAAYDNSSFPVECYPIPSSIRLYPLCYNPNRQMATPHYVLQNLQDLNPNPSTEAKSSFFHNISSCNKVVDTSNATIQAYHNVEAPSENLPSTGYDLSLRLGPLTSPCLNVENSWACEVEELGSSNSHDESKIFDFSPSKMRVSSFDYSSSSWQRDKELCFFPMSSGDDLLESCSGKWSSEDGLEESNRKRKALMNCCVENGNFFSQPKPSNGQCSNVCNKGDAFLRKF